MIESNGKTTVGLLCEFWCCKSNSDLIAELKGFDSIYLDALNASKVYIRPVFNETSKGIEVFYKKGRRYHHVYSLTKHDFSSESHKYIGRQYLLKWDYDKNDNPLPHLPADWKEAAEDDCWELRPKTKGEVGNLYKLSD